jgi:CRP-like cAMP-binding protein
MPDDLNSPTAPRNRFLGRLPGPTRGKLLPLLRPVDLPIDTVLYELGGPVEHAYFSTGAVFSALVVMRDGNLIEVGTVGHEGLMGHHGSGGKTSPHKVIVQLGGTALRVGARELQELSERDGPLRELLMAYHVAFMAQVSQSVACNGLHRLEPRCCRWLLMSRDRIGSDDIRLTHEYLSFMLGARRASVTDALQPLQDAGLVRSSRGVITILDGAGLEARSCECYFLVRDRYDQLLGGQE